MRHLRDGEVPAKLVFNLTLLDALQCAQQLRTDWARIQFLIDGVFENVVLGLERDALDRHETGGRARGHDLAELGEFLVLNTTALDLVAEHFFRNVTRRLGRDRLDDALRVRHHDRRLPGFGVLAHAQKSRGRELVDLAACLAVQVQRDAVAGVTGLVRVPQHGGVVATDFGTPCAFWRRAVEVFQDQCVHGVHTVVDARGHHEYHKRVFVRRAQTQLCGRPEEEWSDVHGSAGLVGWDELRVGRHSQVDTLDEVLLRHRRDRDIAGRMLHAEGVFPGSEDGDLAVGLPERLHTLVALDAVVETWCHAMDGQVRRRNESRFGP